MWPNKFELAAVENFVPARKAPEFCAVSEENGAKLRSLSRWREVSTTIHRTSTQISERRCRDFGNGRNNIQEFSFWQEKNEEVKRFNVTHGFSERTLDDRSQNNKGYEAALFQSGGTPATL
jgi:hypothetical protein